MLVDPATNYILQRSQGWININTALKEFQPNQDISKRFIAELQYIVLDFRQIYQTVN